MELNNKNIKKILLVVFLSAVIVLCVFNIPGVIGVISKIFSYITPIIAALCIAFVLNVLLNALENKVFGFMARSKRKFVNRMQRPLCLTLTYILAFGIIVLLVLVVIPDIIETVLYIAKSLPAFLETAREWVVSVAHKFGIAESSIPTLSIDYVAIQEWASNYSDKIAHGAYNVTSSVVSGLYTTVFSIVISIYILAQKERIGRFLKKVIDTFAPKKLAYTVYYLSVRASESFSRFIGGQFIESIILGVLCYIGMVIFRFPNAPIVSVLVAVTSLVPVVGAFVGVFIGFLLIVISNPIKALLFVLFVLILQQIEGNLIYPKVVGKAVGLPGVIVISAVLVGGNVGGILGALIGVPLSALIYTLIKEATERPKIPTKK